MSSRIGLSRFCTLPSWLSAVWNVLAIVCPIAATSLDTVPTAVLTRLVIGARLSVAQRFAIALARVPPCVPALDPAETEPGTRAMALSTKPATWQGGRDGSGDRIGQRARRGPDRFHIGQDGLQVERVAQQATQLSGSSCMPLCPWTHWSLRSLGLRGH